MYIQKIKNLIRKAKSRVLCSTWDKISTEGKIGLIFQYLPKKCFKIELNLYWWGFTVFIILSKALKD